MLNSGILDFAIGLVFMFLAMSLASGAATEAVSSFLKTRSATLLQGVKELLNDQDFDGLALQLYQHGLISPRGNGVDKEPNKTTDPAYIDPKQFATAFVEIIKGLPSTAPAAGSPAPLPVADPGTELPAAVTALHAKIANVPGDKSGQLRKMLYGIVTRAEGDEVRIRAELSTWFDNAMDRVSGVYKRWSQVVSFVLALIIAALLNVSTIDVAQRLWKQPPDTKAMTVTNISPGTLDNKLTTLETLPVGWADNLLPQPKDEKAGWQEGEKDRAWAWWIFLHIVGWIITAFATLFGAPFWFDALQQIIRLKGSGPSPAEKQSGAAAGN